MIAQLLEERNRTLNLLSVSEQTSKQLQSIVDEQDPEERYKKLSLSLRKTIEQLSQQQYRVQQLEDAVLQKENINLELRFELEQLTISNTRLESRVHQMEQQVQELQLSGSTKKVASVTKDSDYQNVINSLKRVVEKLKTENMELRKRAKMKSQITAKPRVSDNSK